jgi:DNA-binding response OmpR family regulator
MAKETQRKKILVVEDERPLAHALELKLSYAGFMVQTASDGEEALEVLKKEPFDLVLLDLVMPKKDGFAVLEKLRETNKELPVIISSNLSQGTDRQRAKELGANDYFIKADTSMNDVVDHIYSVLGS